MNIDWTTWAGQGRLSDYDEMRTAASFVNNRSLWITGHVCLMKTVLQTNSPFPGSRPGLVVWTKFQEAPRLDGFYFLQLHCTNSWNSGKPIDAFLFQLPSRSFHSPSRKA